MIDSSSQLMIKSMICYTVKVWLAISVVVFISIGQIILMEKQITDPLQRPHEIKYTDFVHLLNYPTQEFNVTTADGYIINIVRIQGKNQRSIQEQGLPPVLMYFGLNCAIEVFSMNYEHISPTFVVANQGFDVWLISNRGTKYSSQHVKYTQDDEEYWDFSWQEMADYDFRAAFDFIYERVGGKKISTLGFSQGTTILLAALTDYPQYQNKITQMILIGPTANIINQSSTAFDLAIHIGGAPLLKKLGFKKLVDDYNLLYYGTKYMNSIALYILSHVTDADVSVINAERFIQFMATYPGGTSLKVYDHWQQLASETTLFRKYDYRNTTLNLLKYGTELPPIYNLDNIKIPTHLIAGKYDRLSSYTDSVNLFEMLKLSSVNATMELYNGGHLYFAIGKDSLHLNRTVQLLIDQKSNQI